MRKFITLTLMAAMLLACYCPVDAKDKDEKEQDNFALYRIAGRKWMVKRIAAPGQEGGDVMDSYFEYEVLNVWDDHAEMSETTLDQGKKEVEGSKFVQQVKFDLEDIRFKDPIGFKKSKIEKVKTKAGTFECVLWVSDQRDDGNAQLWRSVDFPGLVVKQSDRFGTREIVEFTWIDGDPGYKAKAKKKKKHNKSDEEEGGEIDPKRLYGDKGALWIHQTVIEKGERHFKSFDTTQYEVKDVSDEQCEVEVTKLTQLLQKDRDFEPETRVIKFDDSFKDNLEPKERSREERTEKRLTDVGMFECTVYAFKDDEGREGHAWYAKEWPGLMVRRVIKGELYEEVTNLVKFEE
ncbi:MAG: hypothetical protein KDB82_07370 [Planctomycetes bacterium]|nr:hypothetical protein [Planctomycetota bacterium]